MPEKFVPALNFSFLTKFYDPFMESLGARKILRQKILSAIKAKPGMKILDVGCGTGTLLMEIQQKFPQTQTFGVDIDPLILKIARQKIKLQKLPITLIQTGADRLEFKPETFDVIVSSLAFHHLSTQTKNKALKEIHRVLKPNGIFILTDIMDITSWWLKTEYFLAKIMYTQEAVTMKDNVEGKVPEYLTKAQFTFDEIAKPHRGIRFLLAKKS